MAADSSVELQPRRPAAGTAPLTGAPTLGQAFRERPPRTPFQLAVGRFARSKSALVGMVILVVLGLSAVFAGVVAPEGQDEQDLFNIKAAPSREHVLGTDELGRDVLSRLIYGGRISLTIGVGVAVVSTLLGVVVGALAGHYGGWLDAALMRLIDLLLAFPSIFLLLIVFSFEEVGRSLSTVVLFLGLFGWMWLARIIRGEFLSLKQREFVEAARAIGVPDGRLIVRHLLPNVVAAIVVATTLEVAYAMLAEASLSFLGFGVNPATPTWGNMLNGARTSYLTHPLLAIAPGLTLTIAVLAINFVGDGLRDALDPHGRT